MQGAAITAALGGQFSAIIAWLVATHVIYGELTITTTAASGPSLAGNLVSNLHDCACKSAASKGPMSNSLAHRVKLMLPCTLHDADFPALILLVKESQGACLHTACMKSLANSLTCAGGYRCERSHLHCVDAHRARQERLLGEAARGPAQTHRDP